MQIKYVVSTMVFWGREHPLSFEQECQFLKSLGFGIELWPNINGQHECRYKRSNWPRLAAATEDILVAMRARDDDPTLEQWNEQIECAKLLNAHIVTNLQSLGIPDAHELNGCGYAEEVIKLAEQNDVKLCLETGRLPILKQAGERFDSLWFCLCRYNIINMLHGSGRINLAMAEPWTPRSFGCTRVTKDAAIKRRNW